MRKLFNIFKNVYLTKTPIYVVFFVTSVCNARCKMCFNWKNTSSADFKQELSLDEVKKIFAHFSSIQQLTISGGEPFLRQDLPDMLGYISHKNDVQMITIPTNGMLTKQIVEQTQKILAQISPNTHLRISLSLEGLREVHDSIVQVNGAFNRIEETYTRLAPLTKQYRNFNIDIGICCSAYNKGHLKELLDYSFANFKNCSILLVLARGDSRNKDAKDVTPQEYKELLDYYYNLKRRHNITTNKPFLSLIDTLGKMVNYQVVRILSRQKMPSKCYVYDKMIVLQSKGDVFPCEYLNKSLGNLRDYRYNIRKMLNNPDNLQIRKEISAGKCYCTWECALANNIVCNPRLYPHFLKKLIFSRY
jgi:MoaA/NifB/PqqE/SkfB family radical SAM enzyme